MLVCMKRVDCDLSRKKKSNSNSVVHVPSIREIDINDRVLYFSGFIASLLSTVSEAMVISGTSVIKLVNNNCTGSNGKLSASKNKMANGKKLPKFPTIVYFKYLSMLRKIALPC